MLTFSPVTSSAASKTSSSIVKTSFDATSVVLNRQQCISFDLKDVVELVDELACRGVAGNALLVPPLRLRQLCELVSSSPSSSAAAVAASPSGDDSDDQSFAANWKFNSATSVAFRSIIAEQGMNKKDLQQQQGQGQGPQDDGGVGSLTASLFANISESNKTVKAPASRATNTFAQGVWDRAVHMYRLMRHLGRPLHTAPVVEFLPGELLARMDQVNTELELLLLRSRSGKGGDDELCFQFVRGTCPRGASCSFAHSRVAVQRWAQQWAGNNLRDYSNFHLLLKQLQRISNSGNSGAPRGESLAALASAHATANNLSFGLSAVSAAKRDSKAAPQLSSTSSGAAAASGMHLTAAFEYKTHHPLTSGSMLRIAEAVGPEALAIVLDLLQARDQFAPEIVNGGISHSGHESRLHSIVIRNPLTKPTFDVLCSTLELCIFKQLAAVDVSKCELSAGVGRHRIGKLGKTLRRFFNVKSRLLAQGLKEREHDAFFDGFSGGGGGGGPAAASAASGSSSPASYVSASNRMLVALGHNGVTNAMACGFLTAFVAAGAPANREAIMTVTNALTGGGAGAGGSGAATASPSPANATVAASPSPASVAGAGPASSPSPVSAAHQQQLLRQQQQQQQGFHTPANPSLTSPRLAGTAGAAAAAAATVANASFALNDLGLLSGSFAGAALSPNASLAGIGGSADAASAAALLQANLAQATQHAMPTSAEHPLLALNLEFNAIGPAMPDFSDFIGALSDCLPFLEKLSLAGNPLQHDGAGRIFHIGGGGGTTSWRHSCVRYLDVCGCALGDRGVVALCEAVRAPGNFPLRALNVGWNGITPDGAAALGDLLRCKRAALQSLNVAYNPALGRRGAILLSQALKENGTIRTLDVRWCHVQDEGCLALLDALGHSRNTTLAVLKFDAREVDARTVEALQEKLGPVAEACQEELDLLRVDCVW